MQVPPESSFLCHMILLRLFNDYNIQSSNESIQVRDDAIRDNKLTGLEKTLPKLMQFEVT